VAAYDDAVTTLYQAAFTNFVAERKRLAAELKAAGDKQGAAQLLKLQRPPVSAWAVNQLWWQQQAAFEDLIEVAARVKVGDREAAKAHREALARLRELATQVLQDGGNAATEATLRRVTTTLSAIAANGGFAPDAAGTLSADRDPPGFESLGFAVSSAAPAKPAVAPPKDDAAERKAEAEKRRVEEEERKRRLAERERLSGELRDAQAAQASKKREIARLHSELEGAEQSLKETQALLARIERELANL
jgi:hypothetical protein